MLLGLGVGRAECFDYFLLGIGVYEGGNGRWMRWAGGSGCDSRHETLRCRDKFEGTETLKQPHRERRKGKGG